MIKRHARFVALILSVLMVVSQFSVVSFAADEIVNTEQPVTVEQTQDEAQPEEAAASVAETAGAAEETAQEIPAAPAPVKKAAKEAGTKASFNKSKTVDGVKVTVKAGKGVFPKGSKLSVKKVSVPAAVDTENAAETYAFDISIISGGKKIQPDGKAKVSFQTSEVADKNLETAVYHMDGKTPEELTVSESGETAAVTTTGFSVFVLTFCFEKNGNTYTYNLPETGKVSVKNILKTIAPNWKDYTYSDAVLKADREGIYLHGEAPDQYLEIATEGQRHTVPRDFDENTYLTVVFPGEDDPVYYYIVLNSVKHGYTVNFDADGGTGVESQIVAEGDKIDAVRASTTKEGHKFVGWFTADGKEFDIEKDIVLQNLDLTAKWEHVHAWELKQDKDHPNVVTVKCTNPGCIYEEEEWTVELKTSDGLCPGVGYKYDGATVTISSDLPDEVKTGKVRYYENGGKKGDSTTVAPSVSGNYNAYFRVYTIDENQNVDKKADADSSFTIKEKAVVTAPIPSVSPVYDGKEHYLMSSGVRTNGKKEDNKPFEYSITGKKAKEPGTDWRRNGVQEKDAGVYKVWYRPVNSDSLIGYVDSAGNEISFPQYIESEITPITAELEWTPSDGLFTYTGDSQAPTATIANPVGSDGEKLEVEVKVGKPHVNVGDYTATATKINYDGKKAKNYVLPEDRTFGFSIGAAELQPNPIVEMSDGVYGSELSEPVVTNANEFADDVEFTFMYAPKGADSSGFVEEVPTKAGEYQVKAIASGKTSRKTSRRHPEGNYGNTTESKPVDFTIAKKTLRVADVVLNKSYDGKTTTKFEGKATLKDLEYGDDVDQTVKVEATYRLSDGLEAEPTADVGTWPVTAIIELTGDDADNYEPVLSNPKGTINPLEVTVNGIQLKDKEYDRSDGIDPEQFDYSDVYIDGLIDADKKLVTAVATGKYPDANVGEDKEIVDFEITLSGAKAGNYVLASAGNQTELTGTITKKSVTVSDGITAEDKVYDGTKKAVVNDSAAVLVGMLEGDELGITGVSGRFESKDVQYDAEKNVTFNTVRINYKNAELTGEAANNYRLDRKNSQTTYDSAKILPRMIGVEWYYQEPDGDQKKTDSSAVAFTYAGKEYTIFAKPEKATTGSSGVIDSDENAVDFKGSVIMFDFESEKITKTVNVDSWYAGYKCKNANIYAAEVPESDGIIGTAKDNYQLSKQATEPFGLLIAPKPVTINWGQTEFIANGLHQAPKPIITDGIVSGDTCEVKVMKTYKKDSTEALDETKEPGEYEAKIISLSNTNYTTSDGTDETLYKIKPAQAPSGGSVTDPVDDVVKMIKALDPNSATYDSDAQKAVDAYNALTEAQQNDDRFKEQEVATKLAGAEAEVQSEADKKAAEPVIKQIEALNENSTKAEVEAARAAFNALTPAQQAACGIAIFKLQGEEYRIYSTEAKAKTVADFNVKNVKVSKKAKTRKVKATWTATEGVDGYQLYYKAKKAKKAKYVTINNPEAVKKTVKKLKKNKKYTFKIRTFNVVYNPITSDNEKVYGMWAKKSITTKK